MVARLRRRRFASRDRVAAERREARCATALTRDLTREGLLHVWLGFVGLGLGRLEVHLQQRELLAQD